MVSGRSLSVPVVFGSCFTRGHTNAHLRPVQSQTHSADNERKDDGCQHHLLRREHCTYLKGEIRKLRTFYSLVSLRFFHFLVFNLWSNWRISVRQPVHLLVPRGFLLLFVKTSTRLFPRVPLKYKKEGFPKGAKI